MLVLVQYREYGNYSLSRFNLGLFLLRCNRRIHVERTILPSKQYMSLEIRDFLLTDKRILNDKLVVVKCSLR